MYLHIDILAALRPRELAARQATDPTTRVEHLLRIHYDRRFCVTVGDLHHAFLALGMALELGHADEVVVSPLEARGLVALSLFGATLVPAALRPSDRLMSAEHLALALSHRTRMMLVPHTGGLEPDLDALQRAAADIHGGPVLVALAGPGTTDDDGHASASMAEIVVVDLGQDQAISAGQGAAILMDSADLYGRVMRAAAPLARQQAEGLHHPNALNLNNPMPQAAAEHLERTWDAQWERLVDRQAAICATLRKHKDTFHVQPFSEPGRCSFEQTLLCLQDGATTDLERQHLRFHLGPPGRFRPKITWRVPDTVNELLGELAASHTYYRIEDVLGGKWPGR